MKILLFLCAGSGKRLYPEIGMKKQFYPLDGKNELFYLCLLPFLKSGLFEKIYLACAKEDLEEFKKRLDNHGLSSSVKLLSGGNTREESAYAALKEIHKEGNGDALVYIADGDRPFASEEFLKEEGEKAEKGAIVVPCRKMTSSLVNAKEGKYVDRSDYVTVATPQVACLMDFLEAMEQAGERLKEFTDEGSLFAAAGKKVILLEDSSPDLKVSDRASLELARIKGKTLWKK